MGDNESGLDALSLEIEAGRPVVPSTPLAAWVSRTLLYENGEQLKPRWLCAEGFVCGCSACAHDLVAQVVAEKTSEWGGRGMVLDGRPFGRLWAHARSPLFGRLWRAVLEPQQPKLFLKTSTGHTMQPHWMGMAGGRIPNFKRCGQGALCSLSLWNLI